MNCLIIAPAFTGPREPGEKSVSNWEYPLGLCYISAALKAAGHDVVGYHDSQPDDTFAEKVKNAEVVLTGSLCVHFPLVQEIIRHVRRINPKAIVVLGGGLVSGDQEFIHKMLRPDYSIAGEGEIAVCRLLEDLRLGKKPEPMIQAEIIDDIDSLPWADYDLFNVEKYLEEQYSSVTYYQANHNYPRYLPFVASRGCPWACTFCFHPLGRRYKPRSVDSFIAEVTAAVKKYRLNMFGVVDELLAVERQRLIEICAGLKKIGIPWMTQLRVDVVDNDMMAILKDSNCYFISYGIESAVDRILDSMNKKTTVKQIEKALQITWNYDMGIQGNILIADVEDTDETIMESAMWNLRNIRYGIQFFKLQPFPNSVLFQKFTQNKVIENRLSYYRSFCSELPSLPRYTKMTPQGVAVLADTINVWQAIRPTQNEFKITFDGTNLNDNAWRGTFETACIWCNKTIQRPRVLIRKNSQNREVCPFCHKAFCFIVKE